MTKLIFIKRIVLKRKIITGILMILISLVILYSQGVIGKTSAENTYRTEVMTRTNLSSVISASGIVEADNLATMGFLTTGRVSWVGFKEGDEVRAGQIIASLDSTESRLAVAKAESAYKSTKTALDKVIDDIHLSQYGNGGFSNVGSSSETQTQKTLREQAEAANNSAANDLDKSRKQLEWTTIIAPFDGVITDLKGISVGQNITSTSGSSVTVMGEGGYRFSANVDETEFGNLKIGQVGEVVLDAFPDDKFSGTISKIGASATKLATGGSVVPIEISIPKDPRLKNGLNGEASFTITDKENVLVISRSFIHKENGSQFVYVLVSGKPQRRDIVVGSSLGNKVAIISGISEGDKIILGDVKK